jgi:phosphoribosyl 1,2-cyclic phosphodiesterase
MVHACPRPQIYKDRVLSRQGHLSNEAAAELLVAIAHQGLKHVHLAHLSSECNSKELALQIVQQALAKALKAVPLSIAYQDAVSLPILFN